jgi:hypothetical protein
MIARISREYDRSCLGVGGLLQVVAREKGNPGSDTWLSPGIEIFSGYFGEG